MKYYFFKQDLYALVSLMPAHSIRLNLYLAYQCADMKSSKCNDRTCIILTYIYNIHTCMSINQQCEIIGYYDNKDKITIMKLHTCTHYLIIGQFIRNIY